MAPIERIADKLEKPALDDRSYRVIRLPNHLEALLVHDPETDKASASVNVNVGSFSDADDMPGMAHAVEHLLFMGTEKVFPPGLTLNPQPADFCSTRLRMTTASTSPQMLATQMPTPALRKPITSSKSPPRPRNLLAPLPTDTSPHHYTEHLIALPSSSSPLSSSPPPWTVN